MRTTKTEYQKVVAGNKKPIKELKKYKEIEK